jgi:hypothetical protein
MGASQSALSIQKPSQTGPRTHADELFRTQGAAVPISTTAAGEESSAIRALLSAPTTAHSLTFGVAYQRHRQWH